MVNNVVTTSIVANVLMAINASFGMILPLVPALHLLSSAAEVRAHQLRREPTLVSNATAVRGGRPLAVGALASMAGLQCPDHDLGREAGVMPALSSDVPVVEPVATAPDPQ